MNEAFLSIGTNLGDRLKNIYDALSHLESKSFKVSKISSIYKSEPLYFKNQPHYYNLVIQVCTKMPLGDFFISLQDIEKNMGRDFTIPKNYPRIIDIDILTYNKDTFENNILTIPHLSLHKRKFVLLPWNEISKDFIVPRYNKDISRLLNDVKDSSKICKLDI